MLRRREEVRALKVFRKRAKLRSLCGAFCFSVFSCGFSLVLSIDAYLRISFIQNRLRRAARTLGRGWAASSVRFDAGQRAPGPSQLSAAALRATTAALWAAASLRRAARRHGSRRWARLWRAWWQCELRCAARATRELRFAAPHGAVPGGYAAPCAAVWSAKQQRMAVSDAFEKCALDFFLSSFFAVACFSATFGTSNAHCMERTSFAVRFRAHPALVLDGETLILSLSKHFFFFQQARTATAAAARLPSCCSISATLSSSPSSSSVPPPAAPAAAGPSEATAHGRRDRQPRYGHGRRRQQWLPRCVCSFFSLLSFLFFQHVHARSLTILPLLLLETHNRGPPTSEAVVSTLVCKLFSFAKKKELLVSSFFSLVRTRPRRVSLARFRRDHAQPPPKIRGPIHSLQPYQSNQRAL